MQAEEQKAEHTQSLTISAEDLDAALRLLEDEEREAQVGQGTGSTIGLLFTYLGYALVLTVLCVFPSAALVILFDWWMGLRLLAVAAGAVVAFVILNFFGVEDLHDATRRIRGQMGEGEFAKVSDHLFNKRKQGESLLIGCPQLIVMGLGIVIFPFAVWFSSDALILASLCLQALGILTASIWMTSDEVNKFKYLTRVSKLRARLEPRAQQEGQGAGGGVAVSQGEMELLGRAETKRAVREAAKVLEESATEAGSLYAVAYTQEALRALNHEPDVERRQRIREAVDALQFDPHPAHASPAGEGRAFVIEVEDYFVRYEVDDEKERLLVTAVGAREVTHAP